MTIVNFFRTFRRRTAIAPMPGRKSRWSGLERPRRKYLEYYKDHRARASASRARRHCAASWPLSGRCHMSLTAFSRSRLKHESVRAGPQGQRSQAQSLRRPRRRRGRAAARRGRHGVSLGSRRSKHREGRLVRRRRKGAVQLGEVMGGEANVHRRAHRNVLRAANGSLRLDRSKCQTD